MRTCGAEKLPWLVIEVEVDAERAGCFAERQLRLGLVGEEAIPETRDRLGSPVERTKWSQKVRFGADRGDGAAPLSCEVAWWVHGAPARLWVPPHLKSGTLCCKRWPCSLLMLVREKRWFWIASIRATQPVPRACIFDLKLASASSGSAQRRSRGVEHVFDLTGWARTAALNGVEPTHQPRLIVESVEPDLAPDVMSAYRRCTSNSIHVCQ